MVEKNISATQFPIRPLVLEDLTRWFQLVQAVEIDQSGAPQTTEEHLRQIFENPRARRWVVEAPGAPETLVGYGILFAQIPERSALDILVHPAWRRKRIGSLLAAHLCDQARASGAWYANLEILDTNQAGIALLQKNGFEPFSHAWVLRAPADAEFPTPVWPKGFTARRYAQVNDLAAFTQAINRGYGDLWGHHENTTGGVKAEEAAKYLQYYGHETVFVLFAPDGEPIGTCGIKPAGLSGAEEDMLDGPGIAPEHRHLKLQTPMVLHAVADLRSKGHYPVRLESWGDAPETIDQYEALGFRLAEHFFAYRKDLRTNK